VKALLNTDGGARGNPGPAGIGVVLTSTNGDVLMEFGRGIGWATNNVAEYEALIAGLELALEHGVTEVTVALDSQLVVSQVKGEWKIKNDRLRALAVRARSLMDKFEDATIDYVPREKNVRADQLANTGMDEVEVAGANGAPDQQSFPE
jgi:ribonuclease H / adenosylcobalamin/alpha-ribazole phosphatase